MKTVGGSVNACPGAGQRKPIKPPVCWSWEIQHDRAAGDEQSSLAYIVVQTILKINRKYCKTDNFL
jgi:hypothetical protein